MLNNAGLRSIAHKFKKAMHVVNVNQLTCEHITAWTDTEKNHQKRRMKIMTHSIFLSMSSPVWLLITAQTKTVDTSL